MHPIDHLLRPGDLLFIRIANPLYSRVAEACGSWESHVGLVLASPHGGLRVAESTVPLSRYTSVARFLERSAGERFAVLRPRMPLTPEHLKARRRAPHGVPVPPGLQATLHAAVLLQVRA